MGQLEYVTGYMLRKTKNIVINCKKFKECLYAKDPLTNKYLQHREYSKKKNFLTYPSENLTKYFSEIQDTLCYILRNNSRQHKPFQRIHENCLIC